MFISFKKTVGKLSKTNNKTKCSDSKLLHISYWISSNSELLTVQKMLIIL